MRNDKEETVDYESTVIEFLDNEISVTANEKAGGKGPQEDVDVLVQSLLKESITVSNQMETSQETGGEDLDRLFSTIFKEHKESPAAESKDAGLPPVSANVPVHEAMSFDSRTETLPVAESVACMRQEDPVEASVTQRAMENPVLSLAEEPLEFHADPIPVPMPVFTLPPCKPFWNLQTAMIGGAFLCLLAGTGIVYFTGSRSTAPDKTGNPVAGMTPASTRSENHALPIAPPDPSPDTKSSARRADGNSTEKKSAAAVNTVTVTPGAAVRKDAKLAVGGSAIPAGNSSQPAGTPAPVSAVEKPVPIATAAENNPVIPPARTAETAPPTPQTQNTVEPESIPATKTAAIADAPAPTAKPANPPTTPPPTVSKKAMPAVVIFRVLPDYPELARRSHTTGTVVVDILIDEKGKVVKANAVSGPAMLYLNAANAVLLWQFKPATLDGIAVSSSSQVSIVFK